MKDTHCHDLLGGHVLDALDVEDHARVASHLAKCPECCDECGELSHALHRCFGVTVPQRMPNPLVRTQFLARLAVEVHPPDVASMPARPMTPQPPMITLAQQPPAPAGGAPTPPAGSPLPPQRYIWMLGGAAVPAALVLVLGVLFMQTRSQLDSTRSQQASAFAVGGTHRVTPLAGLATRQGMAGEVIVPATGSKGMVLVTGLHTPPAGMSYRCWVRHAGQWVGCGRLAPDSSGIAMVVVDNLADSSVSQGVAVSMERSARPLTPTSPMLLSTTL